MTDAFGDLPSEIATLRRVVADLTRERDEALASWREWLNHAGDLHHRAHRSEDVLAKAREKIGESIRRTHASATRENMQGDRWMAAYRAGRRDALEWAMDQIGPLAPACAEGETPTPEGGR